MNKRPEIIKRIRPGVTEEKPAPVSKGTPLLDQLLEASSSTAPSVEQSIESLESQEVATPAEYWETIEPPPPTSANTLSAWQPELREIAWEHQLDAWEDVPYD